MVRNNKAIKLVFCWHIQEVGFIRKLITILIIICVFIIQPTYAYSPIDKVKDIYRIYNNTKDLYKVKIVRLSCPTVILNIIKEQSNKHNMDWKIIYCIIGYESEFIPNRVYKTKNEESYGLLQVNVKTNFKIGSNPDVLLNPEYNLDYQLDNLKESYCKGVNLDLKDIELVEYISKHGQRADFRDKNNVEYIKNSIKIYYEEIKNMVQGGIHYDAVV